jgi:hypothetical protein
MGQSEPPTQNAKGRILGGQEYFFIGFQFPNPKPETLITVVSSETLSQFLFLLPTYYNPLLPPSTHIMYYNRACTRM